jgi:hypothetical protein
MINFKDVVLSYLEEKDGDATPPGNTSENAKVKEDAAESKSVSEFLIAKATALQAIWKEYYKDYNAQETRYKEPSQENISEILVRVNQISRKPLLVKDVENYIRPLFPLLDLIIYLRDPQEKREGVTNEQKYKAWEQSLRKLPKPHMPIKFNAMSTVAKNLRRDYLVAAAYTDLGANFLASNPDKSIWFIIMKMLEVRKKNRIREVDLTKAPNTVNWVNELLYHPEKYGGGGNKVSANLRAVYEEVTAEKLLGVAFAVKNLFESEAIRVGGAADSDRLKSRPLYEKALIGFYNNQPVQSGQFVWESFKLNESQLFAFSDTYKTLLSESTVNSAEVYRSYSNNVLKEAELQTAVQKAMQRAGQTSPQPSSPQQPTQQTSPPTETPTPPEDPSTNIDLTGGYTIGNILKMSKNAEFGEAAAVYKLLQNFADYVREEEPKDLVGKLQRTAAGLKSVESALGIKM